MCKHYGSENMAANILYLIGSACFAAGTIINMLGNH